MTYQYKAVGWNRQKRIYDLTVAAGVVLYLGLFIAATLVLRPNATIETALIRSLGTCAFLLLHVILSIGPLARIDSRFLPLLYNRRHLGLMMFIVALGHGVLSIVQFHGFSATHPLVSLFTSNTRYDSLTQFPFQPLGFGALVILFLMAATSHDFWLANLTPPWWKRLHMLVYLAYGLLVGHVAFGTIQTQTNLVLATVMGLGLAWLLAVHLAAGFRERGVDRELRNAVEEGFVEVCAVDLIPDGRAHIATIAGDRIAVFRYDGKISAVSNACKHQNGPLGEGRIVNGCIVCPWHGYEYKPASGESPPPFTEKVPTFTVRAIGGKIWIHPAPHPPGTFVEPASVDRQAGYPPPSDKNSADEFYVGYKPQSSPALGAFSRTASRALVFGAAIVALALGATQERFDVGVFEFGNVRSLTGRVTADPYPTLWVMPPAGRNESVNASRFLLVGTGKASADKDVGNFVGDEVRLDGTLIYRDDLTMVEVVSDSALRTDGDSTRAAAAKAQSLGVHTLAGEIVDMKCYLGVMKPGRGKSHKACAINCIRGGIPPVLVVQATAGGSRHFLLVDAQEQPVNDRVLQFVAEPIEITGEVVRKENLYYLKADPTDYRRTAGG